MMLEDKMNYKKSFFVIGILLLLAAGAEEININGIFQPGQMSGELPEKWIFNRYGDSQGYDKVKFGISAPDASGTRILAVQVHPEMKIAGIYNMQQVPVMSGDKITICGEVAGTGKLQAGFYPYGCAWGMQAIHPGKNFKKFDLTFTIKDQTGDHSAYIRPAIVFSPGCDIQLRKLKFHLEKNPQYSARRGYRYYPVYALNKVPEMNLEKDLPLWRDIPEAKGFVKHRTHQWLEVERQTSFKMAYHNQTLYILVRCEEPYMDRIKADPAGYRDGISGDDKIEFSFCSKRGATTPQSWQLVNSQGASWKLNSQQKLPVANKKGAHYWYALTAIAFESVLPNGEKLQIGKDYFFNIGRYNTTDPEGTVLSSFAKGFGNPDTFQVFSLLKDQPDSRAKNDEVRQNSPYYNWLKSEVSKLSARKSADWLKYYKNDRNLKPNELAEALAVSDAAKKAKDLSAQTEIVKRFQSFDKRMRQAEKKIILEVDFPEKASKIFVNGKILPIQKQMAIQLQEGINILGVETVPDQKIRLQIVGHPEAWGKWRGADNAPSNWLQADFDDRKWPVLKAEPDGTFQSARFNRQILYWERTHYGNYRLFPSVRKWFFARNAIDIMQTYIDSPMSFPLEHFTLRFDLPQGIRILQKDIKYAGKIQKPQKAYHGKITVKKSLYPGYDCFVLEYPDGAALPGSKAYRDFILFELGTQLPAGKIFDLYYSRNAGNFVELTQKVPAAILPEPRGSLAKNIKLGLGLSGPWGTELGTDLDFRFLKQIRNLGSNHIQTTNPLFLKDSEKYPIVYTFRTCYPALGGGWIRNGALYEYVKKTPQAQARFFNNILSWGGKASAAGYPTYMNERETTMHCPSFAIREGREEMIRNIQIDAKKTIPNPKTSIFWINWEVGADIEPFRPLQYCFCERCKRDFKIFAKLPSDLKLSDDDIKMKYAQEWCRFRADQDGKLFSLYRKAIAGLGMTMEVYDGYAHQSFWKAAKGFIPRANPGCPGNGIVTGKNQKTVDEVMNFLNKENGVSFYVGQMILQNVHWTTGNRKEDFRLAMCEDGFSDAALMKNALVRLVAGNHGGTDIHGTLQSGISYFLGEATRLIAHYEELFHQGKREDFLVNSKQIAYPDALVLTLKEKAESKRLVLLFNEAETPREVTIQNLQLSPKAKAEIFESDEQIANPKEMSVVIPPKDVKAVFIHE